MILRVPDYFYQFECIADRCKESCCIGWEIDIDEDTMAYYRSQKGDFLEKVNRYAYRTEEGNHSFQLVEHGRCPFLDRQNLCEICSQFGPEALSEVCTEYPRFAIEYGNVLQKCLSLSCEEVRRLFFEADQMSFQEVDLGGFWEELEPQEECLISFLEKVQERSVELLQDKTYALDDRMRMLLAYTSQMQKELLEESYHWEASYFQKAQGQESLYEAFIRRYDIFSQLEPLTDEWSDILENMKTYFTEESYEAALLQYLTGDFYEEALYAKLAVYFFYRYFMNSVYDSGVEIYGRLAVECTSFIRDMELLAFLMGEGCVSSEEKSKIVGIFSKNVEHSEENVETIKEELLWS